MAQFDFFVFPHDKNYIESMNFLGNFIDALNQYSNLLIASLTIAIVYFASRSLRSSREAIQLTALPIFFSKAVNTIKETTLILENHANYPAYDVDILVIGTYFESDIPYKTVLNKEYIDDVKVKFETDPFGLDSEHYGIYDHLVHYAFPPNTKSEAQLKFLTPPEILEIIIQFRDSLGQNYLYQSYLYVAEEMKKENSLVLGDFKSYFRSTKRIEFGNSELDITHLIDIYKLTDHIFLPIRFLRLIPMYINMLVAKLRIQIYLGKDIRSSLNNAFPAGYQKGLNELPITYIEGRGKFSRLE